MSKNNHSIHVLRGTTQKVAEAFASNSIDAGQPVYDKSKHLLYVGEEGISSPPRSVLLK